MSKVDFKSFNFFLVICFLAAFGSHNFRSFIPRTMDVSLETLPDDSIFDIFKRLQTNYLYLIAQTCTRFLDLTSMEYRRRYPNKFVCICMSGDKINLLPNADDVQIFGRKFLNLMLRGHGRNFRFDDELLQFVWINCSVNLQMLRFDMVMLHEDQLKAIHHMLNRLDTLVLHKCGMDGDFYDTLLRHCHRLKHLIVSDSYPIVEPTGNKWLHQRYPALQSVRLCSITMVSFCQSHWESFFLQNPQVTSFSCDHWYLIDSTDRPIKVISKNAVNLKRLYISLRGIGHLNQTFSDLLGLCHRTQFQRLEIQFTGETGVHYLMHHSKILGQMRKLHTIHLTNVQLKKDVAPSIAALASVKQLNFANVTFDNEFAEILSKQMHNVEEIHCDNGANDFTPFVRNAANLKQIVLVNTEMGELNLGWGPHWLSDERKKNPNACPITYYVKFSTIGGTEMATVSSGIVSIQSLISNKSDLLKVNNTFVELKIDWAYLNHIKRYPKHFRKTENFLRNIPFSFSF